MKIDEEVGVMYPYTKECQIFLINHQKPEGHGTGFFQECLEDTISKNFDFWISSLWKLTTNFSCFMPQIL